VSGQDRSHLNHPALPLARLLTVIELVLLSKLQQPPYFQKKIEKLSTLI